MLKEKEWKKKKQPWKRESNKEKKENNYHEWINTDKFLEMNNK